MESPNWPRPAEKIRGNLNTALADLRTHEAEVLHTTFPHPDRLQQLIEAMPEGRSVPLTALGDATAICRDTTHAVILQPCFDALVQVLIQSP